IYCSFVSVSLQPDISSNCPSSSEHYHFKVQPLYFPLCRVLILAGATESTQRFYNAGLEKLNFQQASEDSRRHINSWVEQKT
ncbi:hypothetical protein L345_17108, partial [Ophiophagus hannah]